MEVQDVNTLCVWLTLASICPIWLTLATGCPSLLLLSFPVIYFWESLKHISQVLSVAAIFSLPFYSTACDFHLYGPLQNEVGTFAITSCAQFFFFF